MRQVIGAADALFVAWTKRITGVVEQTSLGGNLYLVNKTTG